MSKAFRPSVLVDVDYGYRGEFESHVSGNSIQLQYATYKELKRNLVKLLNVSNDNIVRVYRHRRGEWGEFFEHWAMVNNKPKIIKQGWM